jgi:hypothetical protein
MHKKFNFDGTGFENPLLSTKSLHFVIIILNIFFFCLIVKKSADGDHFEN